jgi:hypothetical protein
MEKVGKLCLLWYKNVQKFTTFAKSENGGKIKRW